MGKKKEEIPKQKIGFFGKVGLFFVVVGLAGLAWAFIVLLQPQDLSDIEGRGDAASNKQARNLKKVLSLATEKRYPVTITEEELNLYIRDTLDVKQAGKMPGDAKIKEVLVRLEEDRAEVIIVRELFNRPFTVSMYLRINQVEMANGNMQTTIYRNGGLYHESLKRPFIGGRFGKLVVPDGFLRLVLPAYKSIADVYSTDGKTIPEDGLELDLIEGMVRIDIQDGKLVMDPSAGGGDLLNNTEQ